MRKSLARSDFAEFCFPPLDAHVRVDVSEEFVTIRASRDTISASQKEYFVKYLASEGFIPEQYRWSLPGGPEDWFGGIRWIVDYSWMVISEDVLAISRRLVLRLFAGSIVLCLFLLELGVAGFAGDSRIAMGIASDSSVQKQKIFQSAPAASTAHPTKR